MTRDESRQLEKKILDECKKTTDGATDDDVNHLLDHEAPKTHAAKCLAACGQEKIGVVCSFFLEVFLFVRCSVIILD